MSCCNAWNSNEVIPIMAHESTAAPASTPPRTHILLGLFLVFAIMGAAYCAYWWFYQRNVAQTDDAYVAGDIVTITPQVAGTVTAIYADETQRVARGQVLILLDDRDAAVVLAQAEAELAQAVRDVRQSQENTAQLAANVQLRQAELAKTQSDLARRENLAKHKLISIEEVQHARIDMDTAQAALHLAQHQLVAGEVMVAHTDVAHHPEVEHAKAKLRQAYLDLQRTTITAPVSGYVAKRGVQAGQRVSAGNALMAVVPLAEARVDANLKEDQLRDIRIGQPVLLRADLYGDAVTYTGRVEGLAPGTGAVFSVLPAQNATGNWIKIVQRVPVRIVLDAEPLQRYPLRLGLSMSVRVDTRDRSGPVLAETTHHTPLYQADADTTAREAEQRIAEIIRANS